MIHGTICLALEPIINGTDGELRFCRRRHTGRSGCRVAAFGAARLRL
jgi:hypothetical protein